MKTIPVPTPRTSCAPVHLEAERRHAGPHREHLGGPEQCHPEDRRFPVEGLLEEVPHEANRVEEDADLAFPSGTGAVPVGVAFRQPERGQEPGDRDDGPGQGEIQTWRAVTSGEHGDRRRRTDQPEYAVLHPRERGHPDVGIAAVGPSCFEGVLVERRPSVGEKATEPGDHH